jgi:hypothetical protein
LLFTVILEKTCIYLREFPLLDLEDRLWSFNYQLESLLNDLKFQVGHVNAWLRMLHSGIRGRDDAAASLGAKSKGPANTSFGLHKHIIRLKNEIVVRDQIIETVQKVFRRICDRSLPESQIKLYEELMPKALFDLIIKFHRERSHVSRQQKELDLKRQEILESQMSLGRAREELKYGKEVKTTLAIPGKPMVLLKDDCNK